MPKLSVIIPARDEADTLWFTLQSLQMHTRGPLIDAEGMEIVVADNDPGAKTCGKTVREVCAGFGKNTVRFPVRYVEAAEIKSPYYPRMVGAAAAEGDHLVFLDAHVILSPYALEGLHRLYTLAPEQGLPVARPDLYMAHLPVGFDRPDRLFGPYSLRLDKDFWGGWTSMAGWRLPEDGTDEIKTGLHPIGASGIWCFSTSKKSWAEVRGFNPEFAGYAGGEVYLQLKYWLLGGHVLLLRAYDKRRGDMAFGTHWSAPRRYTAKWSERIRNVLIGVSVVAPELLDSVTESLGTKSNTSPAEMLRLRAEAVSAGMEEASWMASARKFPNLAALQEHWKATQVFF